MTTPAASGGSILLNKGGPVHTLIWEHLYRGKILLFPSIPQDTIDFALLRACSGLNHYAAEQALAFGDGSLKGKYQIYFLATDRQVCGCIAERRFLVYYRDLQQVQAGKGLMTVELKVQAGGVWHNLAMGEFHEGLSGFLQSLARLAPQQREPSVRPLRQPAEGDPTGAMNALGWMPVPSPPVDILLRFVGESHRRGIMPDVIANDFVSRTVLHYRNASFGRGMHQGWLMSPLSAADLAALVSWTFGAPMSTSQHPVLTMDFPLKAGSETGKAIASTALGLASLAALGLGWVSVPGKTVHGFRLMAGDTSSCCSFKLNGFRSELNLAYDSPELLQAVSRTLLDGELELLMRRCVCGWTAPPEEIAKMKIEEVVSRLQAVVGPVDPALLTAPPRESNPPRSTG